MTDTLHTIHLIADDIDFRSRLNAGAAKESAPGDPVFWVFSHRYALAAAPSWGAKVDSWLVSNPDGGNGWALDQSVISDGDILAQTQAVIGAGP